MLLVVFFLPKQQREQPLLPPVPALEAPAAFFFGIGVAFIMISNQKRFCVYMLCVSVCCFVSVVAFFLCGCAFGFCFCFLIPITCNIMASKMPRNDLLSLFYFWVSNPFLSSRFFATFGVREEKVGYYVVVVIQPKPNLAYSRTRLKRHYYRFFPFESLSPSGILLLPFSGRNVSVCVHDKR